MNVYSYIGTLVTCLCVFTSDVLWSMPKKGKSLSSHDDELQFLEQAQGLRAIEKSRHDRLMGVLRTAYPYADLIAQPLELQMDDPLEIHVQYDRALDISCLALRNCKELFCAFHDITKALTQISVPSLLFRLTARERKKEWLSNSIEYAALHDRMKNFYLHYLQSIVPNHDNTSELQLEFYNPHDDRAFLKGILDGGDQYSAKTREFASFLLSGVELYTSRYAYQQKCKIFKEELRPAFDVAIKGYLDFLMHQAKSNSGGKSQLYEQIKKDYGDLVASDRQSINTIGAWVEVKLKKYEEQLQQLEDERVRFWSMDHSKIIDDILRILAETPVAKQASYYREKNKKRSGHKKRKNRVTHANEESSNVPDCQNESGRVEEEMPFTICQGRFGVNDPVQNIASLCQRVLSCGLKTDIEECGDRRTLVQRRIDTVRQQLRQSSSIRSYAYHTIMNWFHDPKSALEREALIYPQSNQTEEQKNNNIVAHTFPLEVDGLLEQLAYKFDAIDKPNELLYIIPGSLRTREGSETPGYYTLLVDTTDNKNVCWHRSFTKKEFKPDENWSDQRLYTRPNKSYKRQLGDDRELLDHETIQQRIVELDESSDIQRGSMRLNGKFEVRVDALSVSVADPHGNVFRFMDTKKSN